MPYINHNAVHEAGHVIIALCFRLDVKEVLIKPSRKYTARCELYPTRTAPKAVYGMKIAGSIAVDIQNDNENRSDDNGFRKEDDRESDASCIVCLVSYWRNLGMAEDRILEFDTKMRAAVKRGLLDHWRLVDRLAVEIAKLTTSSSLDAPRIGKIVSDIDPNFYEQVKTNLVGG
jgi:hypothetical protein